MIQCHCSLIRTLALLLFQKLRVVKDPVLSKYLLGRLESILE